MATRSLDNFEVRTQACVRFSLRREKYEYFSKRS
jgi:hypothetical protein